MRKILRIRIVVAMAAAALLTLAAMGCGSSGPKAAVEDFMKAAQAKDCSKMVDLMDLKVLEDTGAAGVKDELIKSCEQEAESGGEIVSYKILEESVEGDKATVKVEATIKQDGEESTETDTMTLNQRDGEWKISFM